MKQLNQQKLENCFANNFATPLFPILANMYYEKKEYARAKKVCEIGLYHNPNNYVGQFILAKTYMASKKYKIAEKILKVIINNDLHNAQALICLVEIQTKLNRSDEKIQSYVQKGLQLGVKHKLFKTLKVINENPIKKDVPPQKKSSKISQNAIQINTSMATKTMYALMVQQQKYDVAIAILEIMKSNKKNDKFVNLERKKMQKLIKKRNT
tara:strand:+ start:108 stop:740 length:633 start_codon:yes stop_codon:yes gene_type:complete